MAIDGALEAGSASPPCGLKSEPATAPRTLVEAFVVTAERLADSSAIVSADGCESLTWREVREWIDQLAAGLRSRGIKRGDVVALLFPNTALLHVLDLAAMCIGAIPVAIYSTSSPVQVCEMLAHSGARLLVLDESLAAVTAGLRDGVAGPPAVIVCPAGLRLGDVPAELIATHRPEAVVLPAESDIATIVYTSGTTGAPKGARISHRAFLTQLRAAALAVPHPTTLVLSFLPLAHLGGRVSVYYPWLTFGPVLVPCPDMRDVLDVAARHHPDTFISPPRLWEKLRTDIRARIAALSEPDERAEADRFLAAEQEEVRSGRNPEGSVGRALPPPLAAVVAAVGFDRVASAFIGGAACPAELFYFYRALGIPLIEGYGSTETGNVLFNRIDKFRIGSCGLPLHGTELTVAPDGELLCRWDGLMSAYHRSPEQTAAAFTDDGFYRTGDLVVMDDEGWVSIIGRKKDVMISSAGKNLAPRLIEDAVLGASPLLAHVVAVGDGRHFASALVVLDKEEVARFLGETAAPPESADPIAELPARLRDEIVAGVRRGNAILSRVERVKRIAVVGADWSGQPGLLTATTKVRRAAVLEAYRAVIDALYTPEAGSVPGAEIWDVQ